MNSVKTLSFAIAAAFAATSASAFEVEFDSADVSYGYERTNAKEKFNGQHEGTTITDEKGKKLNAAGLNKGTGRDHSIDLGVKFTMDYNLFNKVEVGFAQGKTTDTFKTPAQGQERRNTESVDADSNYITNEFGWKDSDLGKVSYTFGVQNEHARENSASDVTTDHVHTLAGEAYYDMFTVGASYNSEIEKSGKDHSVESTAVSFKAYPTDDIRVGYTRGLGDFAGAKNAENKFEVESWWLNGMLIAGANYQVNDVKDRGQDTSRGIHFGFRPVMVTDKVTFDLGYDNSDADAVYSFNVTLATYGVASSLKSDDR